MFLFNSKSCLLATISALQHQIQQSNSAYTTSELGLGTSFSASTSLFSTPVSTVLKLLPSGGWGFFGGVCILNELCGLSTSKASLLSPPFAGCPLARPKTKGYKLSQQHSRVVQWAACGTLLGAAGDRVWGIRQGDGAELCWFTQTSIQIRPKYSMCCKLQAARSTSHPLHCPVSSGVSWARRRHRSTFGPEPHPGFSEGTSCFH